MGWVYNLANPDASTTAPKFAAVTLTLTVLAFIAVLLRVYVRIGLSQGFGQDDVAIIFGVVRILEKNGSINDWYKLVMLTACIVYEYWVHNLRDSPYVLHSSLDAVQTRKSF